MADNAGQRRLSWADFTRSLVEVVPGSIGAFFRSSRYPGSDSLLHYGYDPRLLESYAAHFGRLNPWNAFWQTAKSGNVYASSRTWPSRTLKDTEFYNDWLMKLDNHADGIGIKLGTIADTALSIVLHLPDRQLQESEEVFERVLSSLAGPLVRAVEHDNILQGTHASNVASAAFVSRDADIAIVIDPLLNIVDANATAEISFRLGGAATSREGKVSIANDQARHWLKRALLLLASRRPLEDHRSVSVVGGKRSCCRSFPCLAHPSAPTFFKDHSFFFSCGTCPGTTRSTVGSLRRTSGFRLPRYACAPRLPRELLSTTRRLGSE